MHEKDSEEDLETIAVMTVYTIPWRTKLQFSRIRSSVMSHPNNTKFTVELANIFLWKFAASYLKNGLRDLIQILNGASPA